MKICVAQTLAAKGDIQVNLARHRTFAELAAINGADIIIFPELSLTGYEPTLSQMLATDPYDSRFDELQKTSNTHEITIGVGIPLKKQAGVCISMLLFRPHHDRQNYSKKFLHADEEAFFVAGENSTEISIGDGRIAFAICYELSVPEHAEDAYKKGASIYIASVAKFANGVDKAINRLSEIARQYSQTVFMSNCVGFADGHVCGGKSSIWNNQGELVGQLNGVSEGLLILDVESGELIEKIV